jgi:hypothetical protein
MIGLMGGALAAVANTVTLLIGKAAGVAFLVPVNGPDAPLVALQPINIVMLCLVPALVAALVFVGLTRLTRRPQPIFLTIAGILLIISLIPDWVLPMDSLATRILLSLMHLVAAALIVGTILRARPDETGRMPQ